MSRDIIDYLYRASGDSYAEISRKIGISKAHVSHIIHGQKGLSLDCLIRLEHAYNTPLQDIISQARSKTRRR